MTPYEAWHGEKPKVEHLRVFGCDAYTHILKDERGKFDSKARKCILLGYGQETKGYRLYDPVRQKVLHSRDVRFNEDEKDNENGVKDKDHYVVLDFSYDSDVEAPTTPDESTAEIDQRKASTKQLWNGKELLLNPM